MTTIDQLHSHFLKCTAVCTDTRSITEGSLFVALKGPNFDANAFAIEALAKGSLFAVVDDPKVVKDERYILVPDALTALQDLATFHRRKFDIPIVAITGTNGKTTTKELVHAVLAADRSTLATSGNLNNHIGVPLTLLRMNKDHRIAIVEMGANKIGDIAELTTIAEPTHGLITNIGKAHLEGFGSYEGVIIAKTEMYGHVKGHKGTLFVNGDDELLMTNSAGVTRITYGRDPEFDTFGEVLGQGPFLEFVFGGTDGLPYHVRTALIGNYNLYNALTAVAIAQHFGVPDQRIAEALSAYVPSNNRSQFTDTGKNQLILDAYNANPTSMAAALENFAAMHSDRPKLAILGDMRELGEVSEAEHKAIISLAEQHKIEARFVGPEFKAVHPGTFATAADLVADLKARPITGHLLLIKGSRGIKLETVVPEL